MRSRWLGLVVLLGCGPGSLIGGPARQVKPALSVPYIVGDPVPDVPVRAAFARTPWVAVNFGPLSVPGAFVDAAQNHVVHDKVRREVWGLKRPGVEFEAIDPAELEALRIMPPASHVWLVGPEGPCRATVGKPSVAGHPTVAGVIEVRYALEGCPEAAWAPVGSLVETMPADVRWVEVEEVAALDLTVDEQWEHPFAPAAVWPDESERVADELWILALGVRGLDPLPGQTLITAVWHDENDPCHDVEQTVVGHLLLTTKGAEQQVPLAEVETVVELLGAVAQGESPEALVYGDRLDLYVAVPPASPEDRPDLPAEIDRGPQQWTSFTIDTGPRTQAEVIEAQWRARPGCGL